MYKLGKTLCPLTGHNSGRTVNITTDSDCIKRFDYATSLHVAVFIQPDCETLVLFVNAERLDNALETNLDKVVAYMKKLNVTLEVLIAETERVK